MAKTMLFCCVIILSWNVIPTIAQIEEQEQDTTDAVVAPGIIPSDTVPMTGLTVSLTSNRFTNLGDLTTTDLSCEFIIYGTDSIQWKQGEGNVVQTFVIQRATLEKDKRLTGSGTAVYTVDLNAQRGIIRVHHENGLVRLVLHMPSLQNDLHLDFEISAYEILPL